MSSAQAPAPPAEPARAQQLARRHRRIGWSALACFVAMGLLLESLHGFKVPMYLDLANETRRTMWRLAHAHGSLVALVHLAYAAQFAQRPAAHDGVGVSRALTLAQIALPLGFFAGGAVIHGGDPSLGILLVPVGGLALLWGVVGAARAQWSVEKSP